MDRRDGVVSAIRTMTQGRWRGKFIQTSAPISPGSSGGPPSYEGRSYRGQPFHSSTGQLLDFSSSGLNILALKPGPGLTLEERADGWREEAKDLLNFGRASVKAKKYNDAVDALETAVELAPDFPEIRYELCLAYVRSVTKPGPARNWRLSRNSIHVWPMIW